MSVLYVMVPAALALGITALVSFIWAAKEGQFDDPESDAHRLLNDAILAQRDPSPQSKTKSKSKTTTGNR